LVREVRTHKEPALMDSLNLAYTIITIDESRAEKKANIRKALVGLDEVFVECANCLDIDTYIRYVEKYKDIGAEDWDADYLGEFGVLCSQMAVWEYAKDMPYDAIIVLEDDAILQPRAMEKIKGAMKLLPEDYDTMALYLPENQYDLFINMEYLDSEGWHIGPGLPGYRLDNRIITRAYQRYSLVTTIISRAGAQKLYDLIRSHRIITTADLFVYEMNAFGQIDSYSLVPGQCDIVDIDWRAPSLIRDYDEENENYWLREYSRWRVGIKSEADLINDRGDQIIMESRGGLT